MGKNSKILSIIIIVIATIISYSNSFDCSFQFDDVHSIFQNSYVRDILKFTDFGYWFNFYNRAPAQFTLALNYKYTQLDVFGYHVVNLVIHVLSSVFVFILTGLLISSKSIKQLYIINNKKWIQLFTALIFAVHPIQTQSVTYIIQRMESMSGMFYLGALIFYYIARLNKRKILNFSLFVLFALLAVLTKQTSFSLPLALLLLEVFFIRDKENTVNKKVIYSISGLLLLTTIIMVITGTLPRETYDISRFEYLISQFIVIPKYIFMSFIPIGQNLDHDILMPETAFSVKVIVGFILTAGLLVFSFFISKKNKIISFSILWFFALLALRSSILPIGDLMYEHRLYMSLFGFGLIISTVVFLLDNKFKFSRIHKYAPIVILGLITLSYSIATFQRNKVWKTDISLWADVVKKSPEKFRPNYNIAEALKRNGYLDRALSFYLKANRLDPSSYGTCNNVGNIYYEKKDIKKAKGFYESAISINPNYTKTLNNLANIYLTEKNYPEAEKLYLKALTIDEKYVDALFNLGNLYYLTDRKQEALENYY
ncbi:MAG: tetratricopeptide repeat protein, partial [Candidatus Delongbacteria bacterium]|nr:tetratricopeptide repeat protein [Candidatus Delongbacteria bacterium]